MKILLKLMLVCLSVSFLGFESKARSVVDLESKREASLSGFSGSANHVAQFAVHQLIEVQKIVNIALSKNHVAIYEKMKTTNGVKPDQQKSICQSYLPLDSGGDSGLMLFEIHSAGCSPKNNESVLTQFSGISKYEISRDKKGLLWLEHKLDHGKVYLKSDNGEAELRVKEKTLSLSRTHEYISIDSANMPFYAFTYKIRVHFEQRVASKTVVMGDDNGDLEVQISGVMGLRDTVKVVKNLRAEVLYKVDKRTVYSLENQKTLTVNNSNHLELELMQALALAFDEEGELVGASEEFIYFEPSCQVPTGKLMITGFKNKNAPSHQFYKAQDQKALSEAFVIGQKELGGYVSQSVLCQKDKHTYDMTPYELMFLK